MDEHLDAPLSVDAVAIRIGISRRQLQREFEQEFGQGPSAYYLHMRLARAREMLARTDTSISGIALACGFADPGYFSVRFRQRYAQTPRNYRTSELRVGRRQ
jgi:AraC family carnitine catabolism transcriptional activator